MITNQIVALDSVKMPTTVNTNNLEANTSSILCKGCKVHLHPDFFFDPIRNKTFKQCNNCRERHSSRRRPQGRPERSNIQTTNNDCMLDYHKKYIYIYMYIQYWYLNLAAMIRETSTAILNDTEIRTRHCSMCMRNRPLEDFGCITNENFLTCEGCRDRANLQRHPQIIAQSNNQVPLINMGRSYPFRNDRILIQRREWDRYFWCKL